MSTKNNTKTEPPKNSTNTKANTSAGAGASAGVGVGATHRPTQLRSHTKHLALVEGPNDKQFFSAVLANQNKYVQIYSVDGNENFKERLKDFCKAPGFSNLSKVSIVIDADNSAENSFKKAQGVFKNCRLPIPHKPYAWRAPENDKLQTAVFITPPNQSPTDLSFPNQSAPNQPTLDQSTPNQSKGALEKLLVDILQHKNKDAMLKCAQDFLNCIQPTSKTPAQKDKILWSTLMMGLLKSDDVRKPFVTIALAHGWFELDNPTHPDLQFIKKFFSAN